MQDNPEIPAQTPPTLESIPGDNSHLDEGQKMHTQINEPAPPQDPEATQPIQSVSENTPLHNPAGTVDTQPSATTLSENPTTPNPNLTPTDSMSPLSENTPPVGSTPPPDLAKADPNTLEGRQQIQQAAKKPGFVQSIIDKFRGNNSQ